MNLSSLRRLKRRSVRWCHRYRNPITPGDTRRVLSELVGEGSDLLFVHSSLSACGQFTGGARDVLAALQEVAGTLGLPTHSYSYPTKPGEAAPLFDPATTPSQNGLLTELFWRSDDVVRSIHSTHSVAMSGPAAAELTQGHYRCSSPAGAGTPYARMLERKASALMWGVSLRYYTYFHTAEDAAESPFAYEEETRDRLQVVDESGSLRECLSRRQARAPRRFAEAGDLLERTGLLRRAQLGAAPLLFVPDCTKVHDFMVERLRRTPDFLYRSCRAELE